MGEGSVSIKGRYLCCILAAMIISMSGIRYMLNMQESNIMIYSIYVIYIVCAIIVYQNNIEKINQIAVLFFLSASFSVVALVTALFESRSDIINGIKIVLILMTALSFYISNIKDIRKTVYIFYLIILSYVILILLHPENIDAYLIKGSNYLVLTLPIGLMLTMQLSRIVFHFYNSGNLKAIIPEALISALLFVSLTNFTGRGSMIFPFLVAIIFALILGGTNIIKKAVVVAVVLVGIYCGYRFFMAFANEYIINRMLKLVTDRSSEDRWRIWGDYIDYYSSYGRWILGGGTGDSVRSLGFYPHNIYLQCIGEFGLLGIVFCGYTTITVLNTQIQVLCSPFFSNESNMLFIELSGGLMYLFMNFMKSFQIYDSVVLFMFTLGVISVYHQSRAEEVYE